MIKFSSHSKRRRILYNLTEEDVIKVITGGERKAIDEDRVTFIGHVENSDLPIKVICKVIKNDLLVISNYPLTKRQ